MRPGLGGARRRRAVASLVAFLGAFDLFLAAKPRAVLRFGPLHIGHRHVATITSRYLLVLAGLLLLASLRGLWHGKRRASDLAIVVTAASLLVHPFRRGDVFGLLPTLAILLALIGSRALFPARSDPVRLRQGLRWVGFGSLLVLVYGAAGLWLLDHDFFEPTTLGRSITEALKLLFILPSTTLDPVTRHGNWFIDSVRFLEIIVLAVSMWFLLHPVIARSSQAARTQRSSIKSLIEQYATSGIAYFHLQPDKDHYIADDGRSFIGYRLVGATAVVLGEPIGEPASCRAVARSFAEFCDLNGWTFAYHQVTEAGAALLAGIGLRVLKIGEEAIIPVQEFTLDGSHFKRTRTKVRQLTKEGMTVEELRQPIDDATMRELRELSDAWLEGGGHRERTFTLGAFDPDYLRDTRVLVARSAGGRIEAFVNLLPPFQSDNGNFDMMRRRPDAPNGVMELLFVRLIERFREEGCAGLNLGFAPLANVDGDGVIARALRAAYERESASFNFKGLFEFKDKWRPRWEPRYLAYRNDLQLPQIAFSIARVGERHDHAPRLLRIGLHAEQV